MDRIGVPEEKGDQGMNDDCAFCGCAMLRAEQVLCEDCAATHQVCQTCAAEVAEGLEGYQLVA
jgi:hypothetical protein